jgi:hypothetical protein
VAAGRIGVVSLEIGTQENSWQSTEGLAKECTVLVENRKHQGWVRSWQAQDSKWLHAPQWKKCKDNVNMAIFKLHS